MPRSTAPHGFSVYTEQEQFASLGVQGSPTFASGARVHLCSCSRLPRRLDRVLHPHERRRQLNGAADCRSGRRAGVSRGRRRRFRKSRKAGAPALHGKQPLLSDPPERRREGTWRRRA